MSLVRQFVAGVALAASALLTSPMAAWAQGTVGLEPSSLQYEIAEESSPDLSAPSLGPTPVAQVQLAVNALGLADKLDKVGVRFFGWVEGSYTASSSATGLLSVQTRQNRFGNQALLHQIGLVVQKPTERDRFNLGFLVRYFAGHDAAIGQPKGGIGDPVTNDKFSHDFRDLYVSAHIPVLTKGGLDVRLGRQNTIIGFNGFLAPYRPFQSSDYQFFYSQDGAFTGLVTALNISDQLDVWNGVTMCANTFFTPRNEGSLCYIGQVNYWLTPEKRTRLTGSTYIGKQALNAAQVGDLVTMGELRVQHKWSKKFFQVVQSNFGWDQDTPVGTGSWVGLYTVGILHLNTPWDALVRVDWFRDVRGTRTGFDTHYGALTLGANWHPTRYLEVRPEIRGDVAGVRAYGPSGAPTDKGQVNAVFSALVKF